MGGGGGSESVSPNRGIHKGDSLSSTILLIVFDFILRNLPGRLGAILHDSDFFHCLC